MPFKFGTTLNNGMPDEGLATNTLAPSEVARVADALKSAQISNTEGLASLATRAIRIVASRTDLDVIPIGASRFGGTPDVPEDFRWPTWEGRRLTFLAQIDLSEVNAPGLPEAGWLLFFYDVAEQPWGFDPREAGGAVVMFVEADRSALSRVAHPTIVWKPPFERRIDYSRSPGPFAASRLEFIPTVDIPHAEDSIVESHGLRSDERDGYDRVAGALSGVDDDAPYHHLLGHPQQIQNDMRGECQLVTNGFYCGKGDAYETARGKELLRSAAAEWQLLLQIDTDDAGPGWMWGDAGRIYFWIRRTDLRARAFNRTWLVLQCG